MSIIIRPAKLSDVDIAVKYAEEVVSEGFYRGMKFSPNRMRAFLSLLIEDQKKAFVRALEENDEVIGGFAGEVFSPYFSDELQASDHFFFIKKEYRGKARVELLQVMHEFTFWAESKGAKVVLFGTSAGINSEKVSSLLTVCGYPTIGYLNGRRL